MNNFPNPTAQARRDSIKCDQIPSDIHSDDESLVMEDSPVKAGQIYLQKKFINKNSKASTSVKEDNSNHDSFNSPVVLNKTYKRRLILNDIDAANQDNEEDIGNHIVEEFPNNLASLSSPRNIPDYTSKSNEKSFIVKRLSTEYSLEGSNVYETLGFKSNMGIKAPLTAEILGHIPCLILKAGVPCNKVLVYFHGNGEDIYLSYDLLSHIRNNLNIHILAIEYPGYGLYKGQACEEQILADAEHVFDYLTNELQFESKNIIVFGRSIGTGPATWLASRREVGVLALMSAFTSIRGVVRDLAGSLIQFLVKERFNNLENIAKVKCPTFLVHGLKDNFIPHKHSQELYNACQSPCELILPKEMNHAEFDFYEDFTEPFIEFCQKGVFDLNPIVGEEGLDFPSYLFSTPSKEGLQ